MKVLVVILSLATLFFSFLPCCQESTCCSDIIGVEQNGHDGREDRPQKEDSPCSPFYSCGRCPGFTITDIKLDFSTLDHEQETLPIPYVEATPMEVYFLSIKPPQNLKI